MEKLISALPGWQRNGVALVRIITGSLLVYHGWEVFNEAKMEEYAAWDMYRNNSFGKIMVYMGKAAELIAGVLMMMGFFTRLASFIIICTFLYISFFVGNGKIWYEDQHPFLFVLIGLIFFFIGPGALSLDRVIFKNKKRSH